MSLMKSKLMKTCARLWKDRSGGVMVYTAIALPVLLGVSGLSVDIGSWYADRRAAQVVADAGALAGAVEILRTGEDDDDTNNSSDVQAAALASALENGYDSAAGDSITVNYPPTSGPYAGSGDAIEVIVTRPAEVFVAGILFDEPVTVAARSVAVGAYEAGSSGSGLHRSWARSARGAPTDGSHPTHFVRSRATPGCPHPPESPGARPPRAARSGAAELRAVPP